MTRSRIWTLGTAAVVVIVLAAGWFLLVQPTRAEAAAIKEQTVSQQTANAELVRKIENLKVLAQDVPAQEAKLAKLRQRIPAQPGLPSFIRELSSIASSSNVVLVSMAPAEPAALTVPTPTTTAPAADGSTPPQGEVTLGSTTETSVNFIQAQVTVSGGYFNTEQFFTKMEKLQRAFLVTGFSIQPDTDVDAKAGAVVTSLQIRVFYSAPTSDGTTSTATATN